MRYLRCLFCCHVAVLGSNGEFHFDSGSQSVDRCHSLRNCRLRKCPANDRKMKKAQAQISSTDKILLKLPSSMFKLNNKSFMNSMYLYRICWHMRSLANAPHIITKNVFKLGLKFLRIIYEIRNRLIRRIVKIYCTFIEMSSKALEHVDHPRKQFPRLFS
jgi:hypothetical protein